MQLKSGMRVRCVRPIEFYLTIDKEYEILSTNGEYAWVVSDSGEHERWFHDRFKPVLRVKAGAYRSGKALDVYIKRAVAAHDRLSPEMQQAMQLAQRESWVRGEMEMARYERTIGSISKPLA